jgi:hypothetical protein
MESILELSRVCDKNFRLGHPASVIPSTSDARIGCEIADKMVMARLEGVSRPILCPDHYLELQVPDVAAASCRWHGDQSDKFDRSCIVEQMMKSDPEWGL